MVQWNLFKTKSFDPLGLGEDSQEYEWLAGVDELWGVDGYEEGEMNWLVSLDSYPD